MKIRLIVSMVAAAGIAVTGGCATAPERIQVVQLSPLAYKEYSCERIAAEFDRVSARESDLHTILKKRADIDAVQMGVGALLLWPTLFWLDGDGADTQEYARLKGEQTALKEAAASKQCAL